MKLTNWALVSGTVTIIVMSWFTTADAQRYPPTFIERNGKSFTCYALHKYTGREVPVAGINASVSGFWAFATYNNEGWPVILFDVSKLSRVPDIVARFTYYHECAHLKIPTTDEIRANCTALREMRRNGDLSRKGEEVVERETRSLGRIGPQYGGSGNDFWDATISCAGR